MTETKGAQQKRPSINKEIDNSRTLSTSCVLPMLGHPWYWYGKYLVNFYLGDKNRPEYDYNIFCLLRFSEDERYLIMEQELRNHPNYVTDYDPTENEYTMFVFSIPEYFKEDYDLFKQGKYSHFSVKLKNMMLGTETSGYNYEVLTRSPVLRSQLEEYLNVTIAEDAELRDPPDPEKEIYQS